MLQIIGIREGTIADELQIPAPSVLLGFEGNSQVDILDYEYYNARESFVMSILDGDVITDYQIDKDMDEDLGLEFELDMQPVHCRNKCIFCFVDQFPRDRGEIRPSLLVKDDDYRLSNICGNYVTLTNLSVADIDRIIAYQLSPLYVSVHSTDDVVRRKLLGNPRAPAILPLLQRLSKAGIAIHAQIVYAPPYNDDYVQSTLALSQCCQTLAIVPVGLTRCHNPALSPVTPDQARACVQAIAPLQQQFLAERGSRFVYLADEIYLRAQLPLPEYESYDSFDQLDNGVGLVAQLHNEVCVALDALETIPQHIPSATLVTGVAAYAALSEIAQLIAQRTGVHIQVRAVQNHFFGSSVTVAGLLTGGDILRSFDDQPVQTDRIILPRTMLRSGQDIFLDGMSLQDLCQKLKCPVLVSNVDGWDMIQTLTGGLHSV